LLYDIDHLKRLTRSEIRFDIKPLMSQINNQHAIYVSTLLWLLLACLPLQLSAGALYKWVDEDGQVRYSDRVPPEQKNKQHQQLNSQGVVLSTSKAPEPVKTEEELAAEAEAKLKQEAKDKAEALVREEQQKKDQVLLMTFSSEKEMEIVRDNRLAVLDSVITLIAKSITKTEEQLQVVQTSAEQNFTSKGEEIPGGLAQKIEHFQRKIENRTAQMERKKIERARLDEQYAFDLARFRLLQSQ
jgi:hypothetical protein